MPENSTIGGVPRVTDGSLTNEGLIDLLQTSLRIAILGALTALTFWLATHKSHEFSGDDA